MTSIATRIGANLDGEVVSSDANTVELYAPRAFPPGQPIELTLWPDTEHALRLQARSIGSRLRDDNRYAVRARLINMSRDTRLKLLQAFSAPSTED